MRREGHVSGRPVTLKLRSATAVALTLLAGCNTAVGTELTRATARSVINPIVAERFPGVPLEPATDCIIDNASGEEIVLLASSAAARDDRTATRIVSQVAERPATVRCFAERALPAILGGL